MRYREIVPQHVIPWMANAVARAGYAFRRMLGGKALVSCVAAAVAGAGMSWAEESPESQVARAAGLNGIVLCMEDIAKSTDTPKVSGTCKEGVDLVSTSLIGANGLSLPIEAECGTYPPFPSDYKKSYYSPNIDLGGVNSRWTWSLTFVANENITLTQTQVAFFSCKKAKVNETCLTTDFSISYTLNISKDGTSQSTTAGNSVLKGAQSAAESIVAGYDFSTGQITSGSGAIVKADWKDAVLLEKGGTYTLSLTVSGNQSSQTSTGVGFGGIWLATSTLDETRYTIIPEPTTSAMFLLSLFPLIPRRRRAPL